MLPRSFWLEIRQGLLFILAAIEKLPEVNITPTTRQLREWWREGALTKKDA